MKRPNRNRKNDVNFTFLSFTENRKPIVFKNTRYRYDDNDNIIFKHDDDYCNDNDNNLI